MDIARTVPQRHDENTPLLLGGFAALAESAWMGVAQASDVLEPLRIRRLQQALPRPRRSRLAGLLTREWSVAEASAILMASFFISALLGAVRQILFNAQFGVGPEANAYYAAFRLPDTLFSLIAGGALSSAMIPVLLSARRDEGEQAAARLIALVLTALLAAFSVIVLIGELCTPFFVTHLLAPGFDVTTSRLTVTLTRIMLIQPLILAASSVTTAVLNSRKQFLLTALAIMSHNIALIIGIMVAQARPEVGIYGPTFGVVGGAVLQVLILLPGLVAGGIRPRPAWAPHNRHLREVVALLIPNGLSVGVGYLGFILDTAFASTATEQAALPAIQNAWLLISLPIALLGQAVGQSAFPRLASQAADGAWSELRRTLIRTLAVACALTIPALIGLVMLGRPMIQILFEHGRFDAAAGMLTFRVLAIYAVALPAYVGTEVITRGLIALRSTRPPLVTNSIQLLARGAIILATIATIGVIAIPIAFAVSAAVETLALGLVLWLKLQRSPALISVTPL